MANLLKDDFWENKKILITGHTGFKGSWLASILRNLNSKLYGLSDEKKIGIYNNQTSLNLFEKEYFSDINSIDNEIIKDLHSLNLDYIFHFAAQSLVGVASREPSKTLITNANGTWGILDLFNSFESTKLLTIATTDKVYKYPENRNTETSELAGSEYYSISKVLAEDLIQSFISYELKPNKYITTIRSGNVIGGGDRGEDRLIPDIINSIKKNSSLKIRNLESTRPWQHILDSLYGYLLATQHALKFKKNDIFNLNSDSNNLFKTRDILKIFENELGVKIDFTISEKYKEVKDLKIDSTKATKLLGWRSLIDINDSIGIDMRLGVFTKPQ